MVDDVKPRSSTQKRRRDNERDSKHSSKKKHRHSSDPNSHRSEKHKDKAERNKSKGSVRIVDEDPDEDMWIERNIDMDGTHVRLRLWTLTLLG